MQVLKTPESAFNKITDFPYSPCFTEITDTVSSEMTMAHYQCGPEDGHTVLLMHGEPTWAYLYRKMMPVLAEAGFNVIAPDLIGFGRSDKPVRKEDYSYARHLIWIKDWFTQVVKGPTTLFCQDWGGLLGLRLVADMPDYFSGVMVSNTGLPTGDHSPSEAFIKWRRFSQDVPIFPTSTVIQNGTTTELDEATLAAYDAPFPDEQYKAGARMFPLLVPTSPDSVEAQANKQAWDKLKQFKKPFITAFGDSDPITKGGDKLFQKLIPGCKGMAHRLVENGGHFIQEDQGELLANLLIQFIKKTQLK